MPLLGDWDYRSREDISTYTSDDGITSGRFTVPDREIWQILSLWAEFTADTEVATDRELRLIIQDADGDVMMEISPGVAQSVAAVSGYDFLFAPGLSDLTAVRDTDLVMTSIPAGLLLHPGWATIVQVTADTSDTDGDSDNMVLQLMYASQNTLSTAGGTPQSSDN